MKGLTMRFLFLLSLLFAPLAAQAQTPQVQAQVALDKTGTARRVTVFDVAKPGSDKLVTTSVLTDAHEAIPPVTAVTTQPNLVYPSYYPNTNADFASRVMRCDSNGTHFRPGPGGSVLGDARYCNYFNMEYDGSGRQSGPQAGDYAIGCAANKKDWFSLLPMPATTRPGEADCMTIRMRQVNGDAAGILSNVYGRNCGCFFSESITGNLLADGSSSVEVGVQLGTVDSRVIDVSGNPLPGNVEAGTFGALVLSRIGQNLHSGVRVQSDNTNTWWDNALSVAFGSVETFTVKQRTGDVLTDGTLKAKGVVVAGSMGAGAAGVQVGTQRTGAGTSEICLIVQISSIACDTLMRREVGVNGALAIQNNGTGGVGINVPDGGAIALSINNATRVAVTTTGIGFNGSAPISKPTLPAAATDAATTMALVNAIRSALISYGLAQ